MKALVKKIMIRLMIVEVIASLMMLTITPFIFGSIKSFNPPSKKRIIQPVKSSKKVILAVKKANKKVKKQNLITAKGLLQKAKYSSYMEGSHYLKNNGRMSVILKGASLDKYVGSNVEVAGKAKKSVENPQVYVITVTSVKVK